MMLPGGGGRRSSDEPLFYTIWLALDAPHVFHVLPSAHQGVGEAGEAGQEVGGGKRRRRRQEEEEQAVAVCIGMGEALVMASTTRYCHRCLAFPRG